MALKAFEVLGILRLSTDQFKKDLDGAKREAGDAMTDAEQKAFKVGAGIGNVLNTIGKVGIAAVGAASTAIGGLAKQSMDAYGAFEQLRGGVETLFGDSAAQVMANAENAFQTAGMSINEYLETSIQAAAAMINSLDGDQAKAAELMNTSIVDMSDNVNKMGTTMEAVQNAYRGFSRGNFTMLDNLALGFAGTKEGMQELLDKAKEISGVEFDISSYSDIVQAIHVVQEEMGITGTTASEAASTIQGSAGSMRAAWQNLVTGIGNDNADLGKLIENFVTALTNNIKNNYIPRLQKILQGVGKLVKELGPVIKTELPGLVRDVLPGLLEAAGSMVQALGEGLLETLPELVPIAVDVVTSLVQFLLDNSDTVINAGVDILLALVDGISSNLDTLIPAAIDAILKIADALTNPDNLGKIIDAGFNLVVKLIDGLLSEESINKLGENIPDLLTNIVNAIVNVATKIGEAAPVLIQNLSDGMINAVDEFFGVSDLIQTIGDVINGNASISDVWDTIGNTIAGRLVQAIGNAFSSMFSISNLLAPHVIKLASDKELGIGHIGGSGSSPSLSSSVTKTVMNAARSERMRSASSGLMGVYLDSNLVGAVMNSKNDTQLGQNVGLAGRGLASD